MNVTIAEVLFLQRLRQLSAESRRVVEARVISYQQPRSQISTPTIDGSAAALKEGLA